MNKPKGYKPQVRKTRATHIVSNPEVVSIEKPIEYRDIFDLLEVENVLNHGDVETLPGVMLLRNLIAMEEEDTVLTDVEVKISALLAAKSIHLALDGLRDMGFDVVRDRNVISGAERRKKIELITGFRSVAKRYSEMPPLRQLTFTAQLNLFDILVANNTMVNTATVDNALEESNITMMKAFLGLEVEDEGAVSTSQHYHAQKRRLYQQSELNPSDFKNKTHSLLMRINTPNVREFVESEFEKYENDWLSWYEDTNDLDESREAELFAGQEVDFTILPAGTSIREYAEAIFLDLTDQEKSYVDLERVNALERLRDELGRERCYYVHGKQTSATQIDESGNKVNEDYIGLVIQHFDHTGVVTGEDAIAISPIAKKHAGYLFRYDFSQDTSWRETLSQSKSDAKRIGARSLKFTSVTGKDKYDAFVEKALELFTCPSEQFSSEYELRLRKSGEYFMRKRSARTLGALALQVVNSPL